MALYQPSNITPSTFAGFGGGVIDVNDNVAISWQVNGNSPMTGFSIVIQTNEDTPTTVHTFTVSGLSFYGTSANGTPIYYVYEPNVTWASIGMTNGEEYKMSITQTWGASESVEQYSPAVIVTRAIPSLSVSPANSTTLTNIEQTFTGTYSQAQGDALSWVRWVLSDANGKVLEDTGTIYTGQLSYTYNGFFSGETYTLSCTIETENGVLANVTNTYPVSYTMSESTGGINVICNNDNSVSLTWQAAKNIPGVPSASDYGSISDSVIHLNTSRNVVWSQVDGENMSIPMPYLLSYKARVRDTATQTVTVNSSNWSIWKTYPENADTTDTLTDVEIQTRNEAKDPTTTTSLTINANTLNTSSEQQNLYYPIEACKNCGDGKYTITAIVNTESYPLDPTNPVILQAYPVDSDTTMTYRVVTSSGIDHLEITFTAYPTSDSEGRVRIGGTIRINYKYYTGYTHFVYPDEADSPYDLHITSTTAYSATCAYDMYYPGMTAYKVTVANKTAGYCTVTLAYKDVYDGNDAVYGEATGTFDTSLGTLISVTIVSAETSNSTPITGLNESYGMVTGVNSYKVRIYNSFYDMHTTVVVKLTYEHQVTGADSYKCIVTGTQTKAIAATISAQSATVARAEVEIGEIINNSTSYKVTMYASADSAATVDVDFTVLSALTNNINMLKFAGVKFGVANDKLVFQKSSGTSTSGTAIQTYAYWVVVQIWPDPEQPNGSFTAYYFYFDVNNNPLYSGSGTSATLSGTSVSPITTTISSITLTGKQDCDYLYVTQDAATNRAGAIIEPEWNKDTLFYTHFENDTLQGGTAAEDGSLGVAIYRRHNTEMSLLGIFPVGVTSLTDYAIRSGETYSYELYYVNTNSHYSKGMSSDNVCKSFRSVSLIEATDDGDDSYTPINVWTFKNNLDTGSVSNNNSPKTLTNFTRYPLWQPSSPSPRSGTLMSLLSHFSNGTYLEESVEDMDALYELSHSLNPLFYKDMKGNLYMVKVSSPITQAVDNKAEKRPVTISIPWIEIGDASKSRILLKG